MKIFFTLWMFPKNKVDTSTQKCALVNFEKAATDEGAEGDVTIKSM